jgi:hypothetical protein
MNAQETQLFRDTIMMSVQRYPRGLTLFSIDTALRASGYRHFGERDLEGHIHYLVDKGFMAEVPKTHTPQLQMWRLTAAGTDDLAKRGLSDA